MTTTPLWLWPIVVVGKGTSLSLGGGKPAYFPCRNRQGSRYLLWQYKTVSSAVVEGTNYSYNWPCKHSEASPQEIERQVPKLIDKPFKSRTHSLCTRSRVCVIFKGFIDLNQRGLIMLRWAVIFLVVALVAGVLGFGGIAGAAVGIAKFLFFVFLVLFVLALIFGRRVLSA